MIGAEIKSQEKRRAGASAKYAAGENAEEKVLATGFGNCFAETFEDAAAEMDTDDLAYSGPGENVSHWVFSFHTDESITTEQFQEFVENFMEDQGMKDHKYAWGLHKNTENLHGHLTFLRTKPEPEENGSYKIQNYGGRVAWKNGTNNRYECSRATIIDFCEKYGFKTDFTEVKATRDDDSIKLSQKIQAGEAQTGQPHPKRLIAEQARDVLRQANSWDDVYNELHKYGIGFTISNGMKDGKYWQGGTIKGPQGEKIPLSCLPKDCSLNNLFKKFDGEGKNFDAPKTSNSNEFYKGKLTVNKVKAEARKIFNTSSSLDEAEKRLGERGWKLERQGKTGCYLVYGEEKMKLSALGGKYSLSALSKKYKGEDSNNNSIMHESQSKVNASSIEHASNYADNAQNRASSAQERAADVAAEGIQAKTLSEALDDAFQQAFALDAVRKANRVAAVATERAKNLEEKLLSSQHTEKTEQSNFEGMKMTEQMTEQEKMAGIAGILCGATSGFNNAIDACKRNEISVDDLIFNEIKEYAYKNLANLENAQADAHAIDTARKICGTAAVFEAALDACKRNELSIESVEAKLNEVKDFAYLNMSLVDKMINSSTDNDVSKTKTEASASDTPTDKTALKEEKQLTLADRIADARAKGVFSGGGKPLATGHSQSTSSSANVNKAPRM